MRRLSAHRRRHSRFCGVAMQPFSYSKPTTQDDAIAAIQLEPAATVIAGGTDLLDLMKLGVTAPSQLIDINGLPFAGIEATNQGVTIGALARMSDVARDPRIAKGFPALSQALSASASAQLRNMATVGGNLMQRTRCPYFRDSTFACNKRDPGSGCSAIDGFNRGMAILGASRKCIAVHPSDMAVALVALGADLVLASRNGVRRVAVESFYLLPGDTPQNETVRDQGELIVAVEVPASPAARNSAYLKVRDRASFEFALVSVAAAVEMNGSTLKSVRFAIGGVAARPWRNPAAEAILSGKPANGKNFAAAAAAALDGAATFPLNAFKVTLARNAIQRALETVTRT
jgi:xanthine dehydrogenase YagS FAD-binding subunit